MTAFDTAANFVLSQEGGLSDDPLDPGGVTKYGISKRNYPTIDIVNLTEEAAKQIYKTDYWSMCSCDLLPDAIAIVLFDAAVNQGPSAARRMLQASLGVKQDGVIGPFTQQAAISADKKALLAEFVGRRMFQYGSIPQFTRYGLSWSRRLAKCHQLALSLA